MLEKIKAFFLSVFRFIRNLLLIIILIALSLFFFLVGTIADRMKNVRELSSDTPLAISDKAKRLHEDLIIADWHSDNLLWDRDPLQKLDRGHVDIPRLIEGGYSIQVFDAVIKTPRGLNYNRNVGRSDNITLLAMANRWPVTAWFDLSNRALHQSEILHEAADQSSSLTIIKSKEDLEIFLKLRKSNSNLVGGLLSIEGLHALEGDITNLESFFNAGYRIMGLVHFFDNEVGGSSAGVDQGGLTNFGKVVVQQMNDRNIIIDLAHASEQLFEETIKFSTKPVIVSHTGVKGTYDSPRNLSDDQLRMVAKNGGMVGIGFWAEAAGSTSVEAIVASIRYAVNVMGIDHVGLGSDFDGATTILFDASQIILLTDGLLRSGFTEEEVKKIMGGNQVRFLMENLPTQSSY